MLGACGLLRGERPAQLTLETAEQIDGLVNIAVDQDERDAIAKEVEAARATAATALTPQVSHIKRRLKALQEKRRAAPGASGWRNSYLTGFIDTPGGV